jgi:hypothetical protein
MSEAEKVPSAPSAQDPRRSRSRLFTPDWIIATFTVVLALATLALVGTAIVQHFDTVYAVKATKRVAIANENAAKVMQGQLDEIATEQRPWVRPANVAASDLTVANGKLSFAMSWDFSNSGKTPASDVNYAVNLFPGGKMLTREQEFSCREAEMGATSSLLRIIFPNENGNWNFRESWRHLNAGDFCVSWGGLYNPNPPKFVTSVIIGCVAYRAKGISGFRHTLFAYDVHPFGQLKCPGDGVISSKEIRLPPSVYAKNDAD